MIKCGNVSLSDNFNHATTGLHDAIECPAERHDAIDLARVQEALYGNKGEDQKRIAAEVIH